MSSNNPMDRNERVWFDRLSAGVLILFLAPLLLVRAAIAKKRSGNVFDSQSYHGVHGNALNLRRFSGISRGRNLARLFDIAAGNLAWVGSTPVSNNRKLSTTEKQLPLRPGFISVWRLQRLTGSQYEEFEDPADYPNHSLKESVNILIRYVIARMMATEFGARRPDQFDIFNVRIDNVTIEDALQRINNAVATNTLTRFAFVNPDCLNIAAKSSEYQSVLDRMDTVFADGIGIRIGCRMLGIEQRDNINGTDLFPLICEQASANGQSIYLLGSQPGVTDLVIENLSKQFPDLNFAGHHHGYFSVEEEPEVIQNIKNSGADILLVAFGAPKQEMWIEKNQEALGISVQIGVGGLFDFYSGRISRSPRWLRDIGMEWTWRLIQEPGRMWRRYVLGNPAFLYRVWKQARRDPRRQILQRFSTKETGFLKASIRYRVRHFAWTLALFAGRAARRLLDILVSGTALLILLPFLLILIALIKLESPGPAIFSQTRIGLWGKYFIMYKFRSMDTDAEAKKKELMDTNEMEGGVLFKMKDDPRITKIGKFIRKFSIDELPQFWNVLIGDMSLVGPRPPVPSEVDQYSITDRRRLEIKPGITCIWQVSGRSEIAFHEQVELDVDYIESHSIFQDIRILFKTIPAVLLGKGSY